MKLSVIPLLCALLAACAASCRGHKEQTRYNDTDGVTLDADVPGTEVYLAEKKLGTVPVTLSAKELARLGVPNPRLDTNVILNSDGFGETVFIGGIAKDSERFMFLVPKSVRSDYVSVETPWGIRTRHSGGSFDPRKSFRVNCAKVIRRDGLSLQLEALNPISSNGAPWKLRVNLLNHSPQAIKGFRPSIKICHSQVGPRWAHRGPSEVALPDEWASIDPGKSHQTEISVDPPDAQGEYGIYLIFSLFKDTTSAYLAGGGWCYSNTRLLSVKDRLAYPP
jgi:hypothetical protein